MRDTITAEFRTFRGKMYVWGVTVLFLVFIGWYMGFALGQKYDYISDEVTYIQGQSGNHTDQEKETDLKNFYIDLKDITGAVLPGNSFAMSMEVFIAFGVFLFPLIAAAFIGNEYLEKMMEVKGIYYGMRRIIPAKLLVLLLYILFITAVVTVMGTVISIWQWNMHGSLMTEVRTMIKLPETAIVPLQGVFAVAIMAFYGLLAFACAFGSRNGFAGAAVVLALVYLERYVMFSMFPRWLFRNFFDRVFPVSGHPFFQMHMPKGMDVYPAILAFGVLACYGIIMTISIVKFTFNNKLRS